MQPGDRQPEEIRVLFVEDLAVDAERALHQLKRAGMACTSRRVETEQALISELHEFAPTVILSDFSLPQFNGLDALKIAQQHAPNTPFIFLSGTIGEERAINALRAGAVDYVLKENLARLAPAVRRAITEAAANAERVRQQSQIAHLNRGLRVLSGVNSLVLRVRDRADLFKETCRLATSVGGYTAAIAVTKVPGSSSMQPVAWSGGDDKVTDSLKGYVAESVTREANALSKVIKTGKEFICSNAAGMVAAQKLNLLLPHEAIRSLAALPLVVDNATVALLVLIARDSDLVEAEELNLLREIAGNLSFGLQYLQRDTKVRFLSNFDPQTGLAKRSLFCERVQRIAASPSSYQSRDAVIVLDIERLSIINDSFGRRTGDLLLQRVADRLKQHFPKNEQIAHFSGGTFALVRAQNQRTNDEIRANGLREMEKLFSEPFVIEGQAIPVAARAGFAVCPEDGADATALVQNAEAALRYARATGKKHVHYSAAARSHGVGQLALEHRLRFALERQEFELHYQPKVNIVTRRIQGAEALLRWRSPEDGLVSPAAFLPLLEATGLIVQVGDWVVRQAAQDCQSWLQAGLPPVRVAVNISPAQLRHPDFEHSFLQALKPWATKAWGLDIEITEGVLHEDSPAEIRVLKRLRANGIKIAIDDFGTGYSSLSRLAILPIDTLKIDRSFVGQALGSVSGGSLVKTIVALARAFNMITVAEGVEKQEELDLLWHMGCDQSQGFLHSQALPADEFALILQHGKGVLMQPASAEDSAAL